MISNHVSLLLSKDAKVFEFWEYAPELFVEEQQAVEQERQRQALCCIRNGCVILQKDTIAKGRRK